jgi:protocatechuate 4,5-dioxygenase beta chain/2'-carboxy-2,3-dihydroxybiphenyl 1,2-dioxygenase large subunit/2'-aminobiphenyl-2,3-diol 1,2-dioxygenase large subunit
MGSLVGAYATSHTAMIIRKFQPDNQVHVAVHQAFAQVRAEVDRLSPDVLVVVGSEHLNSFGYDSFPQICVGIGETATGWGDGGVASAEVPLAGAFAAQLLAEGVAAGFDLAFSANPKIDHAFMAPLTLIRPEMDIPVVPVFQNDNTEPLPPLWRCAQLGELLRDVITRRPAAERVVVLGTGGLSHWVGTPEMGQINSAFDERFLRHVRAGDLGAILAMKTADVLAEAGNGAPEIRNWVTAMAAASTREGRGSSEPEWRPGPEDERTARAPRGVVLAYESVPDWATGIALARLSPEQEP